MRTYRCAKANLREDLACAQLTFKSRPGKISALLNALFPAPCLRSDAIFSRHERPDLGLNSVVLQLAHEVTSLQSIMGSDNDLETMINDVVTQQIENRRGMYQVVMLSRVIQ